MDKAILIGLDLGTYNTEASLLELESIAVALNIEVVATFTQKLKMPNIKTYVGSGKIAEVKKAITFLKATMVIFDDELSPAQIRNLEEILDTQIIDRSFLILSIFTERAKTKSATLEVSLAQQKYLLPRLVGMRSSLSRQGGGSYNAKGPGETKLELDRRLIVRNIAKLEKAIKRLNRQKRTSRKARTISQIPIVSLVGYTNAGKSATLNSLIKLLNLQSNLVFEEDLLFATLDTTARKIVKKGYPAFVLTDTIGFLTRLPHAFINSFQSTLSEVANSDLILHIIDGTHQQKELHEQTTNEVLSELNCGEINTLKVYTRLDLIDKTKKRPGFWISNKTLENLNLLMELIYENTFGKELIAKLRVPYNKQKIVHTLNEQTRILDTKYENNYIEIDVRLFEKQINHFQDFIYRTINSTRKNTG